MESSEDESEKKKSFIVMKAQDCLLRASVKHRCHGLTTEEKLSAEPSQRVNTSRWLSWPGPCQSVPAPHAPARAVAKAFSLRAAAGAPIRAAHTLPAKTGPFGICCHRNWEAAFQLRHSKGFSLIKGKAF